MNTPFVWFMLFVTVIFGGMFLLWRKAIEAIGRQVTEHAKLNARAYVALSGCTIFEYTDSFGRKFKYSSPAFGTKQVKSLTFPDGARLEGYSTAQSDMIDMLRGIYDAGRANALNSTSK